uniref:DUF4485 domain-containing protein n=1 Tax=Zeugodacus cucurbitae TaxID=28588 RepID=A0A0A1XN91_ZEUCU
MYEASHCSNESSEYELNGDTLDQLYKEQLQMLRELVFKQSHTEDIELCRKWLKIFSKTSKGEKMARNCLCSLMQQQLQEQGMLGEPFTNLQNCNRDLERVLHELDKQSFLSANYIQQAQTMRTYASHAKCSHCCQYYHRQKQGHSQELHYNLRHDAVCEACLYEYTNEGTGEPHLDGACGNCIYESNIYSKQCNIKDGRAGGDAGRLDELSTECEENEKLTENLLLRRELETLRLQLTEKEIENMRLKEIVEKCEMQNSNYENVLEGIRKNLLQGVKQALEQWNTETQPTFPMKLFEVLFRDFEMSEDFLTSIKAYDIEFEQIITKRFENELIKRKTKMRSHICRKLVKGKKRLQEKYEQKLRMQNWAQRLQLKLVKLKCFSALRQIFINAQLEKDGAAMNEKMWELLRVLEDKYQTIVNEIV